nr:PREDICTED: zinc finger protein 512 [Lepisosteus oculatus]
MEHRAKTVLGSSVSSKRKTSKPKQKGKKQGASKDAETKCKSSQKKPTKSEDPQPQKVQKIKITLGRKNLVSGTKGKAPAFRKPSSRLETKEEKPSLETEKGTVPKKKQKNDKAENKRTDQNLLKSAQYAGSQEERWHLQILDKGRVTCPKCKAVVRKTVEGLKKHMGNCKLNTFTCQHCGKQLKSLTGMKYHVMADHNNLPTPEDSNGLDSHALKDRLRKVLKRMGKLKCTKEGCTGSFTSIMGYLYHTRKCGKEESELEKLVLNCKHCGKPYKSKAGLEYHLKSEHGPTTLKSEEEDTTMQKEADVERTASGRVKRQSAQVAVFHLQEIAMEELLKEWPKRKVQQDLVPDDRKLKYARPGLPAFSQDVLKKWKNEVKMHRKVHCPNQGCDSVYTSVSGLKAHLGLCSRGDFEAGKYKCLICDKEFSSESGVKYHINSIHAQDWFVVSSKTTKSLEKLPKTNPKDKKAEAPLKKKLSHGFTLKRQRGKKSALGPPSGSKTRVELSEKKGKETKKERDCYDFSGSDSPSSSSSSCGSSSSSESEPEEQEAHKHDKWILKRPFPKV